MAPETIHTQAEAAYKQAELEYTTRNPKSQSLYRSATEVLPGGNTRTVLFYSPFPLCAVRAQGSRLWDADSHEYVDLLGEYTAGLYGHSEPVIMKAITDAAANGLNFGSHHKDETKLAQLIKARFSSIDYVRFTNSGTEATLMSLAAAKIYTNRKKIMVFEGGYHGGAFLFYNGNSPINVPHEYLIAGYNDTSSVDALISEHGDDLAAIIVEPMMGSGGCIPATKEFLSHLREKATETKAVLIFDEVMTSRLFSGGGAQSELGVLPDMTTLGKYIGGGMSFGAFGGKKEIMAQFDPRTGTIPHAGTFNNNVLTMAAGSAGLEFVFTPQRARELHTRGDRLREALNEAAEGTLMKVLGVGSIMTVHFTSTPLQQIKSAKDWRAGDSPVLGDLFHLYLLNNGFYIARRGFIALSLVISDEDLEKFIAVVKDFVQEYDGILKI
jgi:glutamate-1-semialdehyde 2,1-aminomutase